MHWLVFIIQWIKKMHDEKLKYISVFRAVFFARLNHTFWLRVYGGPSVSSSEIFISTADTMRCHNTKYISKCDCCLQCTLAGVNWSRLFLWTPRSSPAIQVSLPVALWACWGQRTSPKPGGCVSSLYIDPLYHNSRPETIDPSGVWKERTKGSAAAYTCLLCLGNSGL